MERRTIRDHAHAGGKKLSCIAVASRWRHEASLQGLPSGPPDTTTCVEPVTGVMVSRVDT